MAKEHHLVQLQLREKYCNIPLGSRRTFIRRLKKEKEACNTYTRSSFSALEGQDLRQIILMY
ncbi:MAG: hypothetical protein R2773_05005 [Flavobacteriaceae bacterium]